MELTFIQRAEAAELATSADEFQIISEAALAIFGWTDERYKRVLRLIEVGASIDAAMSLLPDHPWRLATLAYYPPINFQSRNGWFVNLSSDVPPFPDGWNGVTTVVVYAATPALALTAASLRARSASNGK